MGHMTNLSTQIHSSIPQYDKSKVSLKKLSGRYPLGVSKSTFCDSGSDSGLSSWFSVGFGVVESLQVNANDTFATFYHISVCLYVCTIHSAHNNPLIIILYLITIAFRC